MKDSPILASAVAIVALVRGRKGLQTLRMSPRSCLIISKSYRVRKVTRVQSVLVSFTDDGVFLKTKIHFLILAKPPSEAACNMRKLTLEARMYESPMAKRQMPHQSPYVGICIQ